MADDYTLGEETTGEQPVSHAPLRFEKILRVCITIAVLCLAGELVWLLGITPFRPFSRIDINGYEGVDKSRIIAQAGLNEKSSFVSVNAATVEKALMSIPMLQSVRVIKHFPDRLQIILEGRRAVGSVLAVVSGKTVPLLFDSEGVIFKIGGDERDGSLSGTIPVISGIVVENPVPGTTRLPVALASLFAELERIQLSAPELLSAISEIRINRKAFDGFDLVLYPVHRKVKVLVPELNEELLRYTLLMVDVLAANENGLDTRGVQTLDFRSGIASYVPQGGVL